MPIIDMAKYMAERRKKRRAQLIEMSGGACVRCGSEEDLHFDHKDPKEQKFRLNGKMLDGSWEKILEEWTSRCVEAYEADSEAKDYSKGQGKGQSGPLSISGVCYDPTRFPRGYMRRAAATDFDTVNWPTSIL